MPTSESDELRTAFDLDMPPELQIGIAPAQPSPWEPVAKPMQSFFRVLLVAVVLVQLGGCILARDEQALRQSFSFAKGEDAARISEVFELKGRRSNVRLTTHTNVDNNWAYLHYALINESTGEAINLGREVSYYHGSDWKEGDRNDEVFLPRVAAGSYYLRVEPETPANNLQYTVLVERDVPRFVFFVLAFVAILIPYLLFALRRRSFEYERWMNSDYPMNPIIQVADTED